MKSPLEILLAGFGGQGILFAGKVLATVGLLKECEVSWLPSYGPEMRGGTAHCSVTLSSAPIGSPLVTEPDVLIVMNQPSYLEFASTVKPDGLILADSSLIDTASVAPEARLVELAATTMAEDSGWSKLANIVLVGALASLMEIADREQFAAAIKHCVPPRKAELIDANVAAFTLGYESARDDESQERAL